MATLNDLLSQLNNKQYEAVTAPEESLLILAGAGSGKTRVLTNRIAYLVTQGLAKTHEIMAVTFTNKAAKEMIERLEAILPYDLRRMWVGTFHGICHRILRQHAEFANLPKTFQILDASDQQALIKRVMRSQNVDPNGDTDYKAIVNYINRMKENGIRANQVSASERDGLDSQTDWYLLYEQQCQREGVVDFAELLLRTFELLERNEIIRLHYQNRFRHILVDEFQDTNRLQFRWLKIMAGLGLGEHGQALNAVFAVGDDDQSIYGFRGANIGNMQDFLHDFQVKSPIRLEENYRSTGNILNAANVLIANNSGRLGKTLWTSGAQGSKIVIRETADQSDEASWVCRKIRFYHERTQNPWKDFAVLYRTNAQSRELEMSFQAHGIPFRVYGGLRFFERAEVKNVMAYLRVMMNPTDDTSFLRIVNTPTRGIGAKAIESLMQQARQLGLSLWGTLIHPSSQKTPKLEAFRLLIEQMRAQAETKNLRDTIDMVIRTSGLEAMHEAEKIGGEERIQNMREIMTAAVGYLDVEGISHNHLACQPVSDDSPSPIEGFITQATLEAGEKNEQNSDAVQLMTVHSAKGLEFPYVFIVGAEEGIFPHFSATKDTSGLGGGVEEERRLMYVAITRAKKELFISHCLSRMIYGQIQQNPVSSFVEELPQDVTEIQASDTPPRGASNFGRNSSQGYGTRRPSSAPSYGSARTPTRTSAPTSPRTMSGKTDWKQFVKSASSFPVKNAALEGLEKATGYRVGDAVSHPTFGVGTVKNLNGHAPQIRIVIAFKAGEKVFDFNVIKDRLTPVKA